MITIFHLFVFFGMVAGCVFGIRFGTRLIGWPSGVIGAVLGACAGFVVGKLPLALGLALLRFQLERSSVADLKLRLQTEYFISHLIIAHLVVRGEPVDYFRDYVFSLLHSDIADKRRFGWHNLNIWFPELAKRIEDFNPVAPTADCRKKLESIEDAS